MSGAEGNHRESGPRPLHGTAAGVLERLFARQGLVHGAWWTFLVQQEGRALPGGLEELSGFVLGKDGRVHGWWLGWDAGRGEHALERWWEVAAPEREFGADEEYRAARRHLGLGEVSG